MPKAKPTTDTPETPKKKRTRVWTEDQIRRMSEKKRGKPRLFSRTPEETREKMRRAALGNTRALGHRHSPETIAKMRKTWAEKTARGEGPGIPRKRTD